MSTPKAAKAATSATERALKIVENSSRIRVQDLKDNFGAKTARGFVTKYTNHVGVFSSKKSCNFIKFEKNNSELLINKTKNWKSDQLFLSTVKVWVLWIRQRSRRSAGSGATSSSRGSDSSPEWNNSTPISSNRNSRAFQKSIISKIQPLTDQTFFQMKSLSKFKSYEILFEFASRSGSPDSDRIGPPDRSRLGGHESPHWSHRSAQVNLEKSWN